MSADERRSAVEAALRGLVLPLSAWMKPGVKGRWPVLESGRKPSPQDPAYLLWLLRERWSLFCPPLGSAQLTDIRQLQELRNRWAHHEQLHQEDVALAVLHSRRLLRAIGADTPSSATAPRRPAGPPAGTPAPTKPARPPSPPRRAGSGRRRNLTAGSGPRGRRLPGETPDPPDQAVLTSLERAAQDVLRTLVERAGGRFKGSARIPVGDLEPLVALFNAWAREFGEQSAGRWHYRGVPGLWQALDDLYPLENPNRWDYLRRAVTEELERRNWRRVSPPRGSAFWIDEE